MKNKYFVRLFLVGHNGQTITVTFIKTSYHQQHIIIVHINAHAVTHIAIQ